MLSMGKPCRRMEGVKVLIHSLLSSDLDADERQPPPLPVRQENNPHYLLNRTLGGLHNWSGRFEEGNILYFALVGNRSMVPRMFSS
jgi:hypothetical protein